VLAVLGAGAAEAVVVPGIEALSSDQIVQEILLWDLRARGVRVLSTAADDHAIIGGDPGPARMLIRDVLTRVGEHAEAVRTPPPPDGHTVPADDIVISIVTDVTGGADGEEPAGSAARG
jgi:hypothetical protein